MKESVRVKKSKDKECHRREGSKRKKLVQFKREGIINAADEQVLGKGTKVHLESRPKNGKTKDDIQLQHAQEGKRDFKVDSKIKSETERKDRKVFRRNSGIPIKDNESNRN